MDGGDTSKWPLAGGVSSLLMSTRSPTATGRWCFLHFWRDCREVKYSDDHLDQKCWVSWLISSQRFPGAMLTPLTSSSWTRNDERCIRICDGDKTARSDGSSLRAVKDLKLRHASIRQSIVASSEKVMTWSLMTRRKWCLADLTVASHKPPKWGALGELKIHKVPSCARDLRREWRRSVNHRS